MPPDEAAKYCEENNVQRSVNVCLIANWMYECEVIMQIFCGFEKTEDLLIHQTLKSWVYVEVIFILFYFISNRISLQISRIALFFLQIGIPLLSIYLKKESLIGFEPTTSYHGVTLPLS